MEGTLIHSLWACSKLQTFWGSIFNCLSKAFGRDWKPNPLWAVLGTTNDSVTAEKHERQAILFSMAIAKKHIRQMWKQEYQHMKCGQKN